MHDWSTVPKAHYRYWHALQERRKRHRLRANLCNLSDVELMDIGITRGEVDYVVLNLSIDPRGVRSTLQCETRGPTADDLSRGNDGSKQL